MRAKRLVLGSLICVAAYLTLGASSILQPDFKPVSTTTTAMTSGEQCAAFCNSGPLQGSASLSYGNSRCTSTCLHSVAYTRGIVWEGHDGEIRCDGFLVDAHSSGGGSGFILGNGLLGESSRSQILGTDFYCVEHLYVFCETSGNCGSSGSSGNAGGGSSGGTGSGSGSGHSGSLMGGLPDPLGLVNHSASERFIEG